MRAANRKPAPADPKSFVREPSMGRRALAVALGVFGFISGAMMGPLEMWRLERYLAGEDGSLMWLVVWGSAAVALAGQCWVVAGAARSWRTLHPHAPGRWWAELPFLSWFQIHAMVFTTACCTGLAIGTLEYLAA